MTRLLVKKVIPTLSKVSARVYERASDQLQVPVSIPSLLPFPKSSICRSEGIGQYSPNQTATSPATRKGLLPTGGMPLNSLGDLVTLFTQYLLSSSITRPAEDDFLPHWD